MPVLKEQVKLKHSVHLRVDYKTFETLKDYALQQEKSLSAVINGILGKAARVIESSNPRT